MLAVRSRPRRRWCMASCEFGGCAGGGRWVELLAEPWRMNHECPRSLVWLHSSAAPKIMEHHEVTSNFNFGSSGVRFDYFHLSTDDPPLDLDLNGRYSCNLDRPTRSLQILGPGSETTVVSFWDELVQQQQVRIPNVTNLYHSRPEYNA